MTNRLSRVKLYITVAIFLTGSLLLGTQQAQATVITSGCTSDPCTLGDLFNIHVDPNANTPDAFITVDGLKFSNFGSVNYFSTIVDCCNPPLPVPIWDLMPVVGLDNNPLNPGLKYDMNGQFKTNVTAVHTRSFDFSFDVMTIGLGIPEIKDTSVAGKAQTDSTNTEVSTVAIRQIITSAGSDISDIKASRDEFPGGPATYQVGPATDDFTPLTFTSFGVKTIVSIDDDPNRGGEDHIELLSFTQHFSREGFVPAPEPATLFLLGGGLAALGWMRRRRNG